MHHAPFARRALALAAALLAALPWAAAVAEEVHSFRPGGDTVVGTVAEPGASRRLPFHLAEGASLSVSLRADRGSALRPSLLLLGTDRLEDGAATAALKVSKKGDRVTLARFAATDTGRRWLEVGGLEGTTGGWTLTTKVTQPRGAKGGIDLPAGRSPAVFPFAAPGGGTGEIRVVGDRGTVPPEFVALFDPDGAPVLVDDATPDARGFRLRRQALAKPGVYSLRVRSGDAAAAHAVVSVKLKTPKPARRTLDADDVITDPVVFGIDPGSVVAGIGASVDVSVDFAAPDAEVRFVNPPTTVVVGSLSISVIPRGLRVQLGAGSMAPGSYDVEVRNGDGGSGVLPEALAVIAPSPVPLSVEPATGRDDEVLRLKVTGTGFVTATTLALRRGAETIAGTSTTSLAGSVSADVDLRDRTAGAWDVVVTTPGIEPAVLAGAFEIIHDDFAVFSVSPADDADGVPVAATVLGMEFVEGATVRLDGSPDGEAGPIDGTSVVVVDQGRIDVQFDTTDAPTGPWDLVVALPDGRERTLEGAFLVRGTVGSPIHVATPSFGAAADGPVASAWNATRKEHLLVWTEENSFGIVMHWDTIAQRVGADGTALGSPAVLAHGSTLAVKRTPAVAWDAHRDEYLVLWSEEMTITPTQNGQDHPSGKSAVPLQQVVGRVLRGADLVPQGSPLHFSDHYGFPATTKSKWYVDDFHNFRPSAAYDPVAKQFVVAWMQQFDTSGVQAVDDFNVFQRTFDGSTGTLGSMVEFAVSSLHEGDPVLAWDGAGQRVITAYNARAKADSDPLDLCIGVGGAGPVVVPATNGDDLSDPRVAVDPDGGRLLLTWTRVPAKGVRTVEAVAVSTSDLSSTLGDVLAPGKGDADRFGASPAWSHDAGDALVTWSDADLYGGKASVQGQRVALAKDGAALRGDAFEISDGTGDEAVPTAAFTSGSGEIVVFWLRSLFLAEKVGGYPGNSVPGDGTVRGGEIWMVRIF